MYLSYETFCELFGSLWLCNFCPSSPACSPEPTGMAKLISNLTEMICAAVTQPCSDCLWPPAHFPVLSVPLPCLLSQREYCSPSILFSLPHCSIIMLTFNTIQQCYSSSSAQGQLIRGHNSCGVQPAINTDLGQPS